MIKYFKMYEKDKDNFLYEADGLFSGSVVAKMCGMEKSFLVSIARTQTRPYDPNSSTVVFALDYNEGIHIDSLILVGHFKPNRPTEFIKVYLYNFAEEAKIHADYYQGYDAKEEKKKYYISMPLSMTYDYLHYEKDHNYIIIRDQIDRKLKKVNAKLDVITKDNNYVLEIEIEPIHIETTYNSLTGNIIIHTSTDEELAPYKSIKIFEVFSEAFNHETPKITNKLEEQWSWDCKPLNMSKKETKMAIKDIKKNGPATIIFWLDGEKTIVKCQPGDQDDIEKGVIMALVKGIFQKYKGTNNWTEAFKIPYADEIDVEKVIGLALLRDHYGNFMKNPEWHYDYVLRWVYKIKGYKIEDEIAALKALGYSDERIKKCLNTTKGKIREALGQDLVYKKEQKIPAVAKSNDEFIDHIKLPSGDEYKFTVNKEETKKILKDIIQEDSLSEKVIKMFNDGTKIAKIAKSLGISEYFVKKALDEATKPKANPKKAERILKKATKEKIVHKKHVRRTEIEFPNYLEKEECEKILEETKVKYADRSKINCMSELQKYFDRECKHYKIEQLYGNGYSMYEIGRIIGVNAAAVQRMHNSDERKQ